MRITEVVDPKFLMPIGRLVVSKPSQAISLYRLGWWVGGSGGSGGNPPGVFFLHHVWRQFWCLKNWSKNFSRPGYVCLGLMVPRKRQRKQKNGSPESALPSRRIETGRFADMERQRNQDVGNLQGV